MAARRRSSRQMGRCHDPLLAGGEDPGVYIMAAPAMSAIAAVHISPLKLRARALLDRRRRHALGMPVIGIG